MKTTNQCECCGNRVVAGQPSILLNRWGITDGQSRVLIERRTDDDEDLWDAERNLYCGALLHWPTCALHYIDTEIIALSVGAKKQL